MFDQSRNPVLQLVLSVKGQEILNGNVPLLRAKAKSCPALCRLERKAMLKKLIRRKRPRLLYLDHVEGDGVLLFEQIVKMDLGASCASARIRRTR